MPIKTEPFVVNMGPAHPSTHGVFRMRLTLDGEVVLDMEPVFGYLHRGIEKLADNDYLETVGDRIINLERAFNLREGRGRGDDFLPKRLLTEPLQTRGAPGEGQMVSKHDEFLDNYYELRGWSKEGVPLPEKLEELGLGFAVKS